MSAGDVSLETLVKVCLKKRATSQVFLSLFKQLNHKQEVGVEDLVGLLKTRQEFDPLEVVYLTSASLGDQSSNLRLAKLLENLGIATEENQYLILNSLTNTSRDDHFKSQFPFNSFEISAILTSLSSYFKNLLENQQKQLIIFESICYFLNVLFEIIPFEISPLSPEQNELLTIIIGEIKHQGNHHLAETLESNIHKSLKKSNNRQSISNPSSSGSSNASITSTSSHTSHLSFLKTNKLPKFIWLNSVIQNWETSSDKFLSAFSQFVKVKTNQNILNELINTSFECITVVLQSRDSSDLFIKNWKLFFTKKLPILIKSLNLKNIESLLINALNLIDPKIFKTIKLISSDGDNNNLGDQNDDMFSSFPSTNTDIRHDFLRSCIALKLLPSTAFNTILKEDSNAENRPLLENDDALDLDGHVIDLQTRLNQTLIDINPEFIPLEDSGLLEFLNSIEQFEGTKQFEISKLILDTIYKFIEEDDFQHFYRLALGLGLSEGALHSIIFQISPEVLIKPIMKFLDDWEISNDDSNFQDLYSSFGVVLLLFLLIIKKYNISLNQLLLMKDNKSSFCIKFLINLGSLKQFESNDNINHEQSELINGWINALFDSGGISDDLMRLSTVQECFQLFPLIFQHAFIGVKKNLVDLDTVKGGLEYFLQPFLLSTIVGILSWCENYFWKNQDLELLVSLIKNLINPMDLSGDSIHIHKFVMLIYGKNLYEILSTLQRTQSINIDSSILTNLQTNWDHSYNTNTSNTHKTFNFFEINTSPVFNKFLKNGIIDKNSKKIENQSSPLLQFHNQFQSLINWNNQQSSVIISNYDYQNLSILTQIIDEDIIIDYFLGQILESQSLNSKSFHLTLELSTYLLTVQIIDSIKTKDYILNSLKSGELMEQISIESIKPFYKILSTLIQKKKSIEHDNDEINKEIFKIFYNQFIECIHNFIPLKE
ncbi:Mediator of RNA polymerase II transcription subunit 5 [Wickerhamomyces ciferrii]|uniref:Mediator of RNA polymerase II transcription subunit 5 n=1 Tax=Wickerhamomyces ciferrii (strain ATCC 14091 / BCRC 22168 / CBS 111 / JCM 3599 / NBRC 0793 / NRRL Y-1031 F-60-10) TaxID=1206466 RepID=K0KKX0_WICCF|nr:Mediator of RNA polymerase II transcription subunit 5 [Wickerhamomyces ciferrii]CCH42104.1 Mediator of RNA polymerase II transcription subunit 5 [Wickerhamomyces ciferrii]